MKQLLTILLIICSISIHAQRYTPTSLKSELDSLVRYYPGYGNQVQLNVSGLPLFELLNTIALENNLNISVEPSLNQAISYNFFDAKVVDVLLFIYQNFEVEYQFYGSILSVQKRFQKKETPVIIPPKKVDISYQPENEFLSVNLKNDSLYSVIQSLTSLTNKNIVIAPEIRDRLVSAYFLNRPFKQVLELIAKANGFELSEDENKNYYLNQQMKQDRSNPTSTSRNSIGNATQGLSIQKTPYGTLDVSAVNVPLQDLVQQTANLSGAHFYLMDRLDGNSSFEMKNTTFSELLKLVFRGTKYAFNIQDNVFIIGETKSEGVRATALIRMENRTIENVKNAIPKDLVTDLDISEFLDLNGLIVSGSPRKIEELKTFLNSIDIVVPMVQIDVMIVLSERGNTTKSGIKAGLKDKATTTTGTVFPEIDVDAGSKTLNNILDAINGFGVINLGNVTENFYLSLQLLETNNVVDVESTPKITTLNGHSANISIGETTYYQETQVDVQNSVVNQGVLSSRTWKSIDANLTVKIKPYVSSDENVTLTISVTQDDFGNKIDPSAPPNITKQSFESVVRVKNGEVVLLGGLDRKRSNNSGSGVPLISRIPVLRWFFSSREKIKSKSKLHILIRPTVTY